MHTILRTALALLVACLPLTLTAAPIPIGDGYQIIKIEALQDTTTKPFEEAKNEIADKIANEKRRAEGAKFIERLRAEAIIDWKNEEIKKAYEIGLKQLRAAIE